MKKYQNIHISTEKEEPTTAEENQENDSNKNVANQEEQGENNTNNSETVTAE